MPKLLASRLGEDTIEQFRAAASIRYEDAWELFRNGRGTAAIYLWGYVAEMTLKAAWFRLIGFGDTQAILAKDLRDAVHMARTLHGIAWPQAGQYHALFHWARLLTEHRRHLRRTYADPALGRSVLVHSQRVYERWRETLRYKRNRAYRFEVRTVAESTQWLLTNSPRL